MVSNQAKLIILYSFTSISVLLNIASLLSHVFVPKLFKHPGSLIFIHMICEIIVLSHWYLIFPHEILHISKETCNMIAMYSIFFYYAGWFYILFLCLEVYIILRYKAYSTSITRTIIYNISVILLSSLIVLLFTLTNSLGETVFKTCFLSTGSIGDILDSTFHVILIFLLMVSYCLIKQQLGCCYAPVFHHLTRVILFFSITIVISRSLGVFLYFQHQYFSSDDDAPMLIGSVFNIICLSAIAQSRLVHPKLRAKIRDLCRTEEQVNEEDIEVSDEQKEQLLKSILTVSIDGAFDDLADMFENLGHKIIIQILILLTIKYKNEEDYSKDLQRALEEYRGRKDFKKYEEVMYIELANEFCMPFIDKIFCPDVYLIEYESGIFDLIRKSTGFDRNAMLESLLSYENLKALAHINNKGGKSNAFFYVSVNEKIVIKTIESNECSSFLRVLPAYSKRVITHPESKLIRILGLFRIFPHKQDFIIMENAIISRKRCLIYDLKGSTVDRYVGGINSEDPPCGLVMKDLNFKRLGRKLKVENRDAEIDIVINDLKILRNCKLMDYSMLIGIYNDRINTRYAFGKNCSLAVIDFFQRYGLKKSMERVVKRYILRKDKGISVISPQRYYRRIKLYLRSITEEEVKEEIDSKNNE